MSEITTLIAQEDAPRLDSFLASHLNHSRSKISIMIKQKKITQNGKPVVAKQRVRCGDTFEIGVYTPDTAHIEAVAMELNIIYEDASLLVIDKPRGLSVHAGKGIYTPTLINGLFAHIKPLKPGLVHRIDKNTSGLLVVAKNDTVHHFLANQVLDKTMKRYYYAITEGALKEPLDVELPIGVDPYDSKKMSSASKEAKHARSRFTPIRTSGTHSLVHCELFTGRTHQIRAHLSECGYPIIEDPIYNKNYPEGSGQYLFAYQLEFIHPETLQTVSFTTAFPDYFVDKLKSINLE